MTTTMNGNGRKSLAEQIDRLDAILDGLSESLSGAVTDAVQGTVGLAVKEAVQAVLIEVLTNPKVLEKLRGSIAPPTAVPGKPGYVAQSMGKVNTWAFIGWAKIRQVCAAGLQSAGQVAVGAHQHLCLVWRFRAPLLVAAAAGVVSGTAAFVAGPWVAAAVGTMGGFTAAASAQLALTLRRMLDRLMAVNIRS